MNKKGLFVGLCCLDVIYYLDCKINIDKKQNANDFIFEIGGPATNAAITYKILGGTPVLVTKIGNSYIGKLIKSMLKKLDVEFIDLFGDENIEPKISTIFVDGKTGERTVVSGQKNIDSNVEMINVDTINDILKDKGFCFSDCNLKNLSLPFLKVANNLEIPTIIDVGSWKNEMEKFLEESRIIIASNDVKVPSNKKFIDLFENAEEKYIAVTNGGNEIIYKGEKYGNIQPPKVENVVDTLGAGDVLHGAFCYMYNVKKYNFVEALKKASFVASNSVKYKGCRILEKEGDSNEHNEKNI